MKTPPFFLPFFRALGVYGSVFLGGAVLVALWDVLNKNWLQEHLILAVAFQAFLGMGDFFPSLFLSSLALAFSFSVRSADFPQTPQGRIDPAASLSRFFYLALTGALVLLVFQFVAGPLSAQWIERFKEDFRMVSYLEGQLREGHERQVKKNTEALDSHAGELRALETTMAEKQKQAADLKAEALARGLLPAPEVIAGLEKDILALEQQILDKRRNRPLGMNILDWRENALIPYQDNDPASLTYEEQLGINEKILLFRPGDERALEAVNLLKKALQGEQLKLKSLLPGALETLQEGSSSRGAGELLVMAETELGSRNFLRANALAFLAFRLYSLGLLEGSGPPDRDFETRSQAVLDRSYEEFGRILQTEQDYRQTELSRRLEKALRDHELERYSASYYELTALKREYPDHPEVSKFLVLAEAGLKKTSLFIDEGEEMFQVQGSGFLAFLNPLPLAGMKELVTLGNMVMGPRGAWFKDVEVIRWDEAGKVSLRFKAPFGLFSGGLINMNFLHRTAQGVAALPEYLVGTPEIPALHRLNVDLGTIEMLSRRQSSTSTLSVYDLFSQIQGLRLLGYSTRLLETVVIQRSLESLLLLAMAFFTFWVSWFFRSRHLTQAPPGLIFLSIFLPLTVWVLYSMVLWVFALMVGALIPHLGFYSLLVLLGAGGTGLLVLNVVISLRVLNR